MVSLYPSINGKSLIVSAFTLLLYFTFPSLLIGQPCNDVSTLNCSDVELSLPISLTFDGSQGGMTDGAATATGFTMVLPPSARLTVYGTPFDAAVPGYEPSKLSVSGGNLTVTSTKGIFFSQPTGSPNSSETNSQINALGVALSSPSGLFEVKTTLNQPNFAGSSGNNSQQGGLWFGIDEDHYVKLALAKTGSSNQKVQLQVENMDFSSAADAFTENNTSNFSQSASNITLRLEFDPVNKTVKGFYKVNGGSETQVGGALSVPANYFNGADLDGTGPLAPITYAGIFTTQRRAAADQSIDFTFQDFAINTVTPTNNLPTVSTADFTIAADATVGQVIGQVSATDSDGAIVSYALTDGNVDGFFNIDNTGELSLASGLGSNAAAAYPLEVTVTDDAGGEGDATITVNVNAVTVVPDPFDGVQVNFQNEGTTPPAGYEKDFGSAYADRGNGFTYGWIDVNNGNPVSLEGQGRNRGADANTTLLQATTIHMDHPATPPTGYWELQVPNGDYEVTVGVGDKSDGGDPEIHFINAEGVSIIANFDPDNNPTRFSEATQTITILDGKLTLDYVGGVNTKLTHVEVVPSTIQSTETDITSFSFNEQTGPASIDLSQHTVAIEVASGSGLNLVPAIEVSPGASINPIGGASTDFSSPVTYTVTAEDATTTQEWTVTVTEAFDPIVVKVNFMSEKLSNNTGAFIDPPTGYEKDFGQAYGTNQTQDSYPYGWKKVADDLPIDVSNLANDNSNGSGRNRLGAAYNTSQIQQQLEGTLMHMQGNHIGSWSDEPRSNEVYWEVAVPNGTYEVKIGAGDYSTGGDPEVHTLNVEGISLISTHLPQGSNFARLTENTLVVAVTDGALTVNAFGGINTKITYIEITETTDPAIVAGNLSFNPSPLLATLEPGQNTTAVTDLTADAGTPTIGMIEDPTTAAGWLALPTNPATGSNGFPINANGLSAGDNPNSTVIASAVGYIPQALAVELTVEAPAELTIPYRINVAGGSYDLDGDLFDPEDVSYLVETQSTTTSSNPYEPNPGNTDLYFPRRSGPEFGYAFPVANGNYEVVLHMVENFFDEAGQRVFDVAIEGNPVITGLDLVSVSGQGVLNKQTFTGTVNDGVLNIDFIGTTQNAIIQAIEILEPTPPSEETDILTFVLPEQTGAASIDASLHTVEIEVNTNADLTNLVPTITLSDGATIAPNTGEGQNFSNPVNYVVTAENGVTAQAWTVTVNQEIVLSVETDIISFSLSEETGPANIDELAHTVDIEVASGTDLTQLVPTIELSPGATINPPGGQATNLTSPFTYEVTAEDGVTTQNWTVTLSVEVLPIAVKVNFMNEGNTPPAGYDKDFGQAFGTNQTQDGYDYGWKKVADDQPIDVSNLAANNNNGSGRNRLGNGYASATTQQQLEGSLMHMQGNHLASWAGQPRSNEVYWEINIPNGNYEVKIGAGDYSTGSDPEVHTLNVEGISFIATHIPQGNNFARVTDHTLVVNVSDGALTVNAFGGTNTKITYIEITETTDPAIVAGILSFDPSPLVASVATGESTTASTTLTGDGGLATIGMIEDPETAAGWLALPVSPSSGSNDFAIDASSLGVGSDPSSTVIASAVGYVPVALSVDLTVESVAAITLPYRINVGGETYDLNGDIFQPENTAYLIETAGTTASAGEYTPNPGDTGLYFPRRFGEEFSYAFPIANGNYQVVLHMVENFHTAIGARIFDVDIEGITVIDDLDLEGV